MPSRMDQYKDLWWPELEVTALSGGRWGRLSVTMIGDVVLSPACWT